MNNLPGLNITANELKAIQQRVDAVANERRQDDHTWVEEYFPRVLPAGWETYQRHAIDGLILWHKPSLLSVILSGSREEDGKRWLHLSVAHRQRIPAWSELKLVKDLFLGPHLWAIQVLPTADKYVNINPRVLHLWHCVDGIALPDFTGGTGSI